MADETDMTRVICPLHELADPGARGFTMGEGDWPLKGFVVRQGERLFAYADACPQHGTPMAWRKDDRRFRA